MPEFRENLATVASVLALLIVVVILLSPPSLILMKGVTFLDTQPFRMSGNTTFVETTMDFGTPDYVKEFPLAFGEWYGEDYPDKNVPERLGADVMILRAYDSTERFIRPVVFLIVQSTNTSSFHPPTICYPMSGWVIEEETTDTVPIKNATWAAETYLFNGTLTVNRMIVHKENETGNITERQCVLYFYVKNTKWSVNDQITMIRVSAPIPLPGKGDIEGMTNIAKEFLSDAMPFMFEFKGAEKIIATQLVDDYGIAGGGFVVLLLGAPIGLIAYQTLRRIRK